MSSDYGKQKFGRSLADFVQGKLQKTLSLHFRWKNVMLVRVAIS
jgi:hypothetical protein